MRTHARTGGASGSHKWAHTAPAPRRGQYVRGRRGKRAECRLSVGCTSVVPPDEMSPHRVRGLCVYRSTTGAHARGSVRKRQRERRGRDSDGWKSPHTNPTTSLPRVHAHAHAHARRGSRARGSPGARAAVPHTVALDRLDGRGAAAPAPLGAACVRACVCRRLSPRRCDC